jgi:hypothetical protein
VVDVTMRLLVPTKRSWINPIQMFRWYPLQAVQHICRVFDPPLLRELLKRRIVVGNQMVNAGETGRTGSLGKPLFLLGNVVG